MVPDIDAQKLLIMVRNSNYIVRKRKVFISDKQYCPTEFNVKIRGFPALQMAVIFAIM